MATQEQWWSLIKIQDKFWSTVVKADLSGTMMLFGAIFAAGHKRTIIVISSTAN